MPAERVSTGVRADAGRTPAANGDRPMEEEALIRRCLEGDETAWRWLIERHRERLFRVAMGLLGNAGEAEEAVQVAFVQVFRHLARFRRGSSFYTWICRICINQCLRRKEQLQRSRRRNVSLDGEDLPDRIEALVQGETPEEKLDRSELGRLLREGMRQLPEEFQTALVLREMDGLTYEEIAATLGVAMGTVKSRVHRGRSMLKEYLKRSIGGADYAT